MTVPNIITFRIDERLIHGQGQLWAKALGVNTVIVVNDSVSEDPVQQMLMKIVVPKTIAMCFFSIQHTRDVIMKASPKQAVFIVCKTPENAFELVAGGISVEETNVGDIYHALGKEEVSKYTAPGDEDKAVLRQLRDTYGVVFNTRAATSGDDGATRASLNKYL